MAGAVQFAQFVQRRPVTATSQLACQGFKRRLRVLALLVGGRPTPQFDLQLGGELAPLIRQSPLVTRLHLFQGRQRGLGLTLHLQPDCRVERQPWVVGLLRPVDVQQRFQALGVLVGAAVGGQLAKGFRLVLGGLVRFQQLAPADQNLPPLVVEKDLQLLVLGVGHGHELLLGSRQVVLVEGRQAREVVQPGIVGSTLAMGVEHWPQFIKVDQRLAVFDPAGQLPQRRRGVRNGLVPLQGPSGVDHVAQERVPMPFSRLAVVLRFGRLTKSLCRRLRLSLIRQDTRFQIECFGRPGCMLADESLQQDQRRLVVLRQPLPSQCRGDSHRFFGSLHDVQNSRPLSLGQRLAVVEHVVCVAGRKLRQAAPIGRRLGSSLGRLQQVGLDTSQTRQKTGDAFVILHGLERLCVAVLLVPPHGLQEVDARRLVGTLNPAASFQATVAFAQQVPAEG